MSKDGFLRIHASPQLRRVMKLLGAERFRPCSNPDLVDILLPDGEWLRLSMKKIENREDDPRADS